MCESSENAIAEQCRDDGFGDGWDACRKQAVKIMKQAMSEIGVPQARYPANVANAYKILEEGRQRIRDVPDEVD